MSTLLRRSFIFPYRMKLLVIEEGSELRNSAGSALQEAGVEVISARDAAGGSELVSQQKPDAVLLEPLASGSPGFEMLHDLRQLPGFSDLPLIVTTVNAIPAEVLRAKQEGADEVIEKQHLSERLVSVVRSVLNLRKTAVAVKFWGTRGSIATPGPETVRYGGNTSCVEVRCGNQVLIFDCGTGARELGLQLAQEYPDQNLELYLFVSHTHWDHIQGFPFFQPAYRAGNRINIFSQKVSDRSVERIFTGQMDAHYFPVTLDDLSARLHFEQLTSDIQLGDVRVSFMHLNHPGHSVGFRVQAGGKGIVYVTDHEPFQKLLGSGPRVRKLDSDVDEFARGAELYIREAQYTDEEYKEKRGWGHSSLSDVVESSLNAKAKRVALFHHDPMHDDRTLDSMVQFCRKTAKQAGGDLEIFAAEDKLSLKI
jgi:phosphoribosyl 1,2-cyclic phosphodiesterase/CheY-like chemotaxis protein